MTQQLQDSIDRFINAVDNFAKRQAAKDIGAAIGEAVGSSFYVHKKTEAEIDAMTDSEQASWVADVEANPPL